MKLYHIWFEYDIGLNINGNQGVYSSEENMWEAFKTGFVSCMDEDESEIQGYFDEGLANWDIIEG